MYIKDTIYESYYDDMYNPDLKIKFLEETQTSENTKKVILSLFRKIAIIEYMLNKDICVFNLHEINEMVEALGYVSIDTIRVSLSHISSYIKWCIANDLRGSHEHVNNVEVFLDTQDLSQFITKVKNKNMYITEEKLYREVSELYNFVDRAIFIALFEGIGGEELYELRSLQLKNIDFQNKTIHLVDKDGSTRIKNVSYKLIDVLIDANKQDKYYQNNGERDRQTNLKESPYIIKPADRASNDIMINYSTIHTRFKRSKMQVGLEYVTPSSLHDSGAINRAFELAKEAKLDEPNDEIWQLIQQPAEYNLSDSQLYRLVKKYEYLKTIKH